MPIPAPPPKGKDRWGMPPARRGRVRGMIRNLRRSSEIGEFGEIKIIEFDLFVDDGQPLVPVRMSGTYFNHEPHADRIAEVRDPDPAIRPIMAHRLYFPPTFEHEIVAYYPGRDDPPPWRQRVGAILMVAGPIVFVAVAVGLFITLYR
jgi:hypothetical protein